MEINELQHPDSIWTWKSNTRRQKASLWLPYFSNVTKLKGDRYCFEYNGGSVTTHLKQIDCIMLYGASGDLPVKFLDALNTYKIPLIIHRRNLSDPYFFLPTYRADQQDILTAQITHRQNQIKSVYIARTILRERLGAMNSASLTGIRDYRPLSRTRSMKELRLIEAHETKRYWHNFYRQLNLEGTIRRDRHAPVNKALNAGSLFLSGIILRWVLYHRLSPQHGFLHTQTNYPSLVYDLIEPFRFIIEQSVHQACNETDDDKNLVAYSIERIKVLLNEKVYVPATHQLVYRKSTLHGIVLALRAYLVGDMKRFLIPVEGIKKGGRPPKVSYRLPGEIRN
jgi:CRISPR-associated endonuclease Cas1